MGASGHIAGVINPPTKNKRSYWTNDKLPATHEAWLEGASRTCRQLVARLGRLAQGHAGKQVAAPKSYGKGAKYKAIEPAPGRYVKAKA
jgi:polyhydroxyalkanoate synthase